MSGTSGLLRQIGLRHLVERPLRTALTAGGIAAGVALVFSITSMNAALNDTVRSTVGVGSTFSLVLPTGTAATPARETGQASPRMP